MAISSVEFAKSFRIDGLKAYVISFVRTGSAGVEILSTKVNLAASNAPVATGFPSNFELPSFREVKGVFIMTNGTGGIAGIVRVAVITASVTDTTLAGVEMTFGGATARPTTLFLIGY